MACLVSWRKEEYDSDSSNDGSEQADIEIDSSGYKSDYASGDEDSSPENPGMESVPLEGGFKVDN